MAHHTEKITLKELAKQVVEATKRPMTASEIWEYATDQNMLTNLRAVGKTPEASLGSYLFTTVKKPDSPFYKIGARPARFFLKTLEKTISSKDMATAIDTTLPPKALKAFSERDLHPLLVWFASNHFDAYCRTIFHQESQKKGSKHHEWVHPDIVGFSLTTQNWESSVFQLAKSTGSSTARLYSFELKLVLEFASLRESFFQAVSNSSWAHEGYLVAAQISDDLDFQEELRRLSQSFGIGVIRLDVQVPYDSKVIFPSRDRSEIDWETVNKISAINSGFEKFISAVAKSITINEPTISVFDEVLEEEKFSDYIKKLQKK